jgi:hypothetical protein
VSRSLSWIDPGELSAALVRAGVRREPRDRSRPANLYLLRAGGAQAEPAEPFATAAAPRAAGPVPRTAPAAERFDAPEGTLQKRLEAFIDWVTNATGSRRLFVADAEGLVLIERETDHELIAVSSSFMSLLERIRSCLGSETRGVMALDLDEETTLHMVQVRTGLGRFTLGLVAAEPVRRSLSEGLRSGLESVLRPEEAL